MLAYSGASNLRVALAPGPTEKTSCSLRNEGAGSPLIACLPLQLGRCCRHGEAVLLRLGLGGQGLLLGFLYREVLPLPPAIKVDQGLHAAPLHDLALEPNEVNGLNDG